MLAKIMAAIRRALMMPFNFADWIVGSIFGGAGSPGVAPEFEPGATAGDLAEAWTAARGRTEAEHMLHRDAVETVQKFLGASPAARAVFDLSGLSTPLQDTLIGMSTGEIALLRTARLSVLRRFVDGAEHGIEGAPRVQSSSAQVIPLPVPAHEPLSVEERMIWKIRAQLGKTSDLYMAPKAVAK